MARLDFPLCIYCDNDKYWYIQADNGEITYVCLKCGNLVIVTDEE